MSVVNVDHVSKLYQLGQRRGSLREAIAYSVSSLFRRAERKGESQQLWALNDVSFRVEAGEALGIIGHNGAGKSTILKLLSRITFPTSGSITINGRIAALIELGAGFHPELSGRENIYLNASILGLKRREIDSKFDEIIDFAGLDKFIDTPVKRYSSGMYVRLAFAVAAHVRADVLLVDEVLSVGDTAFQQKCLSKMEHLRDQGAAIVLVSHNLWTVESFCKRAILMRAGQIETEGSPGEVVQVYRQYERQDLLAEGGQADEKSSVASEPAAADKPDETVISSVELFDAKGASCERFESYSTITVQVNYSTPRPIDKPFIAVQLYRSDGMMCCKVTNRRDTSFDTRHLEGEGSFSVMLGPLPLVPDAYTLEAHIMDSQQPIIYASSSRVTFYINGDLAAPGEAGVFYADAVWHQPEAQEG